jgi:hypothetical protein
VYGGHRNGPKARKSKTGWHHPSPLSMPLVERPIEINPGDNLLSHAVTHAVPSALEGLTTVFGMGTGVAPPV